MAQAWQRMLEEFLRPRMVLVGVGNRLRGDDAFGPLLVGRLREKVPWAVLDAGETPESYVGRIASFRPQNVLLLDALRHGAAPGSIGFFPSDAIPFQGISTHAISLRLFAELLALRAGCSVALLGVEPRGTALGAPLSAEMAESLERVVQHLAKVAAGFQTESDSGR